VVVKTDPSIKRDPPLMTAELKEITVAGLSEVTVTFENVHVGYVGWEYNPTDDYWMQHMPNIKFKSWTSTSVTIINEASSAKTVRVMGV